MTLLVMFCCGAVFGAGMMGIAGIWWLKREEARAVEDGMRQSAEDAEVSLTWE